MQEESAEIKGDDRPYQGSRPPKNISNKSPEEFSKEAKKVSAKFKEIDKHDNNRTRDSKTN